MPMCFLCVQNNQPADYEIEEKYGKNSERLAIRQIDGVGGEERGARKDRPAARGHGERDAKEEGHDRAGASEIEEYVVEIGDHDERQQTVAEYTDALEEADLARE